MGVEKDYSLPLWQALLQLGIYATLAWTFLWAVINDDWLHVLLWSATLIVAYYVITPKHERWRPRKLRRRGGGHEEVSA